MKKGVEKLYIDKISGINTNRPKLKEMLEFIREGDTSYFVSISRLSRNTRDFLELMDIFNNKGINVVCIKEPIDTTTAQGKMIATIFASMYEMERENIRQRQKEGIEIAKKRYCIRKTQTKNYTRVQAVISKMEDQGNNC